MSNKSIAVMLVCLLLTACSDPKEQKIPTDINSWGSDKELQTAVSKLSDNDKKLFTGYIVRTAMASAFGGKGVEPNTTIRDAINIQQTWTTEQAVEKEKQRLLAEETQKKRLSSLKEMNSSLTASLIKLTYNEKDYKAKQYSDYFSIEVAFKNNTTDDISAIKGFVILKDVFGEPIKRIGLSNDTEIKAGETYIYQGTIDYNQFQEQDKKLASADPNKLQFEWEPGTYIFINGKKQTMPK